MGKGIRRSCKFFDYGVTAPSAYGAFCALQKICIDGRICLNCKKYKRGVFKFNTITELSKRGRKK